MPREIQLRASEFYCAFNTGNIIIYIPNICAGIGLYLFDVNQNFFALAHIFSPYTKLRLSANDKEINVKELVPYIKGCIKEKGIPEVGLKAKVCGGASMRGENKLLSLGTQNLSFAAQILNEAQIQIVGQDVGGLNVRTLECNLTSGEVKVKTRGQDLEKIL